MSDNSFLLQDDNDEKFKQWLTSQGLDDPKKMLETALYLVKQKYEGAKSIAYLDQYPHEGFVVYQV